MDDLDLNSKINGKNNLIQDQHIPFYKRIFKHIYNFLFELPFENYKLYYKTGIIQKMSIEEKKKLSMRVQREELHRNFFVRMIKIRPQILDEEDFYHLNEVNHSLKNKRMLLIIGLGLNWSYFSFNYIVLRKKKAKVFLCLNLLLFMGLVSTSIIQAREHRILYEKYKKIYDKDEIFETMRKLYNINQY
jgi:hypothetical protein